MHSLADSAPPTLTKTGWNAQRITNAHESALRQLLLLHRLCRGSVRLFPSSASARTKLKTSGRKDWVREIRSVLGSLTHICAEQSFLLAVGRGRGLRRSVRRDEQLHDLEAHGAASNRNADKIFGCFARNLRCKNSRDGATGHIDTAPIKSQPACKTSLHGFVAQTPWVCFISNLTKRQRSALPSR